MSPAVQVHPDDAREAIRAGLADARRDVEAQARRLARLEAIRAQLARPGVTPREVTALRRELAELRAELRGGRS